MSDIRRKVGDAGEDAVAGWYTAAGFAVIARNWRVRGGEIDLVARNGDTLVFCEVKTRRSAEFGLPFEAVTPRKQARIRALATQFLSQHDGSAANLRFDVASVRPSAHGWVVDVIESAF